ncbi:hypothetical protein FRB94_012619 [Tulasnella sp. JGI-2019a]|nr:hypothetical protein FRB94_012619 [Tulasnella sp. JGI-2019a]KAG9024347.1 hypothetical protein FRB95_011628 [Tulasnella sp. JGI-2019a]
MHLHRRLCATRSICAARTRNTAAGPAADLHGASATAETQSGEELSRPTKRPRTVVPVTTPIPAARQSHTTQASAGMNPFIQPDTLQERKSGTGKIDFQ